MACRYFLDGKEYDATQLREVLKELPPERMAKYVPAAKSVLEAKHVPSAPDKFLKQVFKEMPEVSDKQAEDLLKVFQERPQDMADALNAVMEPTTFDKFLEGWKAGLVSAPSTQGANIAGNAGEIIARLGETATASILDSVLPGVKTRLRGEAAYELKGAVVGYNKGLGRLGSDLKDILRLAPEKVDFVNLDRAPKISGKTGRFIRTPFRLLSAFDDFFRSIGGEAELHKLAFREARGDIEKAKTLIANPSPEMLKSVEASQLARTYQDPNKVAEHIMQFRANHKWAHVILPFVQVPSNIARIAWQRSPAGFYEGYKALQAYRQAAAKGLSADEVYKLKGIAIDKLARPLFGTMVLTAFYAHAKAGGMTGSGPTEQKERNLLRSTGWQPYSFVFPLEGDKKLYVPFNRFEPLSSILGIAADLSEIKDEKKAGDMADKAIGSIVQNFTSKTYLAGISDVATAVSKPNEYLGQYVSNLSGTLVPNIVAKAAQTIDPKLRDTRPDTAGFPGIPERIGKTLLSRIPGASMTLDARKGATGEDIERPGYGPTRFLLPVQPSTTKGGTELEATLASIGYSPSSPKRDVTLPARGTTPSVSVRLSDEEYGFLQKAHQKASDYIRKNLIGKPEFKRLPGTIEEGGRNSKEAQIRRIYDRFHDNARAQLKSYPSFRSKVQKAQRDMPRGATISGKPA